MVLSIFAPLVHHPMFQNPLLLIVQNPIKLTLRTSKKFYFRFFYFSVRFPVVCCLSLVITNCSKYIFISEKSILRLTFNSGLALTYFRTSRPTNDLNEPVVAYFGKTLMIRAAILERKRYFAVGVVYQTRKERF